MSEYGFSLTLILPYKDRIEDSNLIRGNMGQIKSLFSHILPCVTDQKTPKDSALFPYILLIKLISITLKITQDENICEFHFILDITDNPKLSLRNIEVLKNALQKILNLCIKFFS